MPEKLTPHELDAAAIQTLDTQAMMLCELAVESKDIVQRMDIYRQLRERLQELWDKLG